MVTAGLWFVTMVFVVIVERQLVEGQGVAIGAAATSFTTVLLVGGSGIIGTYTKTSSSSVGMHAFTNVLNLSHQNATTVTQHQHTASPPPPAVQNCTSCAAVMPAGESKFCPQCGVSTFA
jgi:membrane protease subunit (stomatin/prohibitin family)